MKIERWNLIFIKPEEIEATLLPEERCKVCGRELITRRSLISGVCGVHSLRKSHTGTRSLLIENDPDFNKGHGKKFMDAFDRAIKRGDFK